MQAAYPGLTPGLSGKTYGFCGDIGRGRTVRSLAGLLAVSLAHRFHGWGVVAKSIARGSASNTPLET
ncbi:MAG: hypothetical protein AAFX81_21580, partial [Pseudomonadota bacterium]